MCIRDSRYTLLPAYILLLSFLWLEQENFSTLWLSCLCFSSWHSSDLNNSVFCHCLVLNNSALCHSSASRWPVTLLTLLWTFLFPLLKVVHPVLIPVLWQLYRLSCLNSGNRIIDTRWNCYFNYNLNKYNNYKNSYRTSVFIHNWRLQLSSIQ